MSNSTLKLLLKEYDKKRLEKELELDKKLELFYSEHPEVSNINDKINNILPLHFSIDNCYHLILT